MSNAPLSPAEKTHVSLQMEEIKATLLKVAEFSEDQSKLIAEQFDDLKESSGRLGRKDWRNNFIGVIVSLIISLSLDPAKANLWFAGAVSAVRWLWTEGAGLLK